MLVAKAVCRFVLLASGAVSPFFCMGQTSTAGAVAGTVVAPDGNPIPGASVNLSAPGAQGRRNTSANDGTFAVRDLASGSYTVRVTLSLAVMLIVVFCATFGPAHRATRVDPTAALCNE
jgi:hypothetical protein